MPSRLSLPVLVAAVLGPALLVLGAIYLTVECQSLPGFMGPSHGDTSPRTGLGVVWVALGLVALVGAFLAGRRRSRT